MKKERTLLATLVITVCLSGFPFTAKADQTYMRATSDAVDSANWPLSSERIVLAEAEPLSADEMQNLRGGFIDPTGLIYNFAVNVLTAVNGADVFTRSINVSPSGPGGQFQATSAAALLPQNIPSNLGVSMINGGNGLSVTDANGNHTMILNQTASGAPISAVFNTISNNHIGQSVNMTLTLNNLSSVLNLARTPALAAMTQNTALRSLGF